MPSFPQRMAIDFGPIASKILSRRLANSSFENTSVNDASRRCPYRMLNESRPASSAGFISFLAFSHGSGAGSATEQAGPDPGRRMKSGRTGGGGGIVLAYRPK